MSIHWIDLILLKRTLGPPRKFKHLTRAEEVIITRLRIGHTKATKSHILSRGPPTACQHCGQTLTIEHMLLECTVLQQIRDEYYTAKSLRTLFETIPEACIVEFLGKAGFFYLIWQAIYSIQHIIRITHQLTKFGSYINHQTLTTPLHSVNYLHSINSWENPTCERRLICLWGRVSSLNKCNPIQWFFDRDILYQWKCTVFSEKTSKKGTLMKLVLHPIPRRGLMRHITRQDSIF